MQVGMALEAEGGAVMGMGLCAWGGGGAEGTRVAEGGDVLLK